MVCEIYLTKAVIFKMSNPILGLGFISLHYFCFSWSSYPPQAVNLKTKQVINFIELKYSALLKAEGNTVYTQANHIIN